MALLESLIWFDSMDRPTMCKLINKTKVHIDKITENIVEIGFHLGCCIWYCLGLDELVKVIDDE